MSHTRQASEVSKTPHSVMLKVLRLSKPQLAFQFPLPYQTGDELPHFDARAALSHAPNDPGNESVLSPLLTLPPTFGTVHVGETFSCALCGNHEVPPNSSPVSINGVHMSAVMQTPSNQDGIPLRLYANHAQAKSSDDDDSSEQAAPPSDPPVTLESGETLARIVRFDLREEGQHVLAVTVTYTESYPQAPLEDEQSQGLTPITRGKVRAFRKLYPFTARQLLSVRTKAQMLAPRDGNPSNFILEAQLENQGEAAVVLESLNMVPAKGLSVRKLNAWDIEDLAAKDKSPTLDSKHVLQSCFLFKPESDADVRQLTQEGRVMLGQLSIDWRGTMGEKGSLSTGYLVAKRKY